jgi:glycerate-2-kinase
MPDMTIEEALSRLAMNTGRIADAMEAIASNQGIVADVPGDDSKPPASKKKTAKKASKKKTGNKTKVGKPEEPTETDLTIKDDVRPVLKRLREEVNHAAVKSLLKKHGASTLQQLDPSKFQRIIDDANAELGDADDIDDAGLDDDDDL